MFNNEHLQEKWAPLLNYEGLDPIKDSHRKAVTAVLLENQEKFLREEASFNSGSMNLMETPTNAGNSLGGSGGFGGGASAGGGSSLVRNLFLRSSNYATRTADRIGFQVS